MSDTLMLLQALIRNECTNDGTPESGNEWRSVETLADYIGRAGTIFEPIPGRQSVTYRVAGSVPGAPALMLMGHLDVVPANPAGWSRDPFGAEISDGFVWGRGAVDMLNLTASMAVAFLPYLRGERETAGDLIFLAVADEEAAAKFGAELLVKDHWDRVACDYLLTEIAYPPISTSTGMAYPVSVGEKGPFWTVLQSSGTPGHGSTPFGRDNALEPLVASLHGLFATPSPVLITPVWERFVEGLGLEPELAMALTDADRVDRAIDTIAVEDPGFAAYVHACTHLTVSPNVVSGGVKANVIPDLARSEVDLRALPGMSRSDVDLHLRKAMGRSGDRIELIPISDHEANASNTDDPLWEVIVDSIESETGSRQVLPTMMPATTDARFFRSRGIPSYGVGLFDQRVSFPDFLTMFHGHDERVSLESVASTTRLLEGLLERWNERWAG